MSQFLCIKGVKTFDDAVLETLDEELSIVLGVKLIHTILSSVIENPFLQIIIMVLLQIMSKHALIAAFQVILYPNAEKELIMRE